MKKLYFDVETTGTNPEKHGLIQFSGIIEINGEIKEKFDFNIKPFESDLIEEKALIVNNKTKEEIKSFPEPNFIKKEIISIFDKYIDKFNREDKFIPIGYNVSFDINFLNTFFKKLDDNYLFSYINPKGIDVYAIFLWLCYSNKICDYTKKDHKLESVCNFFNIPIKAHDALEDILATRKLLEVLESRYLK